jgi:putative ABC transport system permease protein
MTGGKLWRRFRYWVQRDRLAQELDEEMRLHLDLRAQRLGDRYAARRQFGNYTAIQEASMETWGWSAWGRLLQDFRIAGRTLWKSPGFAAIAVLTLAVGLGINTAVFSVVNAVMLRGLPYPDPGRVVSLWEEAGRREPRDFSSHGPHVGGAGNSRRTTVSPANLLDYQRQSRAFAGLAAFATTPMNLTGIGAPERIPGESVTWNFFEVLGIKPAMGRSFLPDDDVPGATSVVILSDDFWRTRLGGEANVLGRTIVLEGEPYRVIGILPPSFESPAQVGVKDRMQFYVPARYSREILAQHGDHDVNVVGRLKPGVKLAAAQADLALISANLARQYPTTNEGITAVIAPLRDDLVRNLRDSLVALMGAAALIVLITCVNVANLMLVRAVGRRHESSVRLALGASRFRLVRQFLAESLVLAAAGCAAGILLGRVLMALLTAIAPAGLPQIASLTMDWRVFAVAAGIATATGLLFGIAPAWQASQTRPAEALKTTARNTGGQSQTRWRTSLTVLEIALSLVLTVGAGLLLKSFVLLMGVDLGFQPDRVLAMNINLPEVHYGTATQRLQFFQQLEERVKSLPGVQSVAYANRMPLRGGWGGSIVVEDAPEGEFDPDLQAVSPGYFQTLGIPLARGRLLTPDDRTGHPIVAVVNQAFERQYLQGKNAIGRRLARDRNQPWLTVVGVVNDIRRAGKSANINPQVYLPAAQTELYPTRLADLAVRTPGNPRQLVNALQREVWALDKDQPVTNVRTMEEIIDASVAQRRFQTLLLTLFAGVAVALAMVGIFGVLSFSVHQRTPELGLRIALGAPPRTILAMVLKQAGSLIGAGVAIGLAGAFGLTRYVESLLFGIQSTDWATYAAAVALLAVVALAAALIPARRGAKVDPIVALRYE